MCGVVGLWCRESVFDVEQVEMLFDEAAKRGSDGFGVAIAKKIDTGWQVMSTRSVESWQSKKDYLKTMVFIEKHMEVGCVLLANFRAQPATEAKTTSTLNVQPIIEQREDLILVHNGAVADLIVHEVRTNMGSMIDSEAIIWQYLKNGKNMKKTMEHLIGGYSFLMLDLRQNRLYAVCDYKPLAIGYVRGKGMVFHSSNDAIGKLIQNITGADRCGMCVWEDYYYHWQDSYDIREIDLDSGIERETKFRPRFVTPVIDTAKKGRAGSRSIAIVSGGIDSMTTAYILKACGDTPQLVHFVYGQKSENCELAAVNAFAREGAFRLDVTDLRMMYLNSPSSLVNKDVPILTATEEYMKSVTSWVECRNLLFLSIAAMYAERMIIQQDLEEVNICAGFVSLEEEGFFPDDSERLVMSFMETLKYGSIVGDRIKFVNVLQNVMKYETIRIGTALGVPYEYSVSCDEPRLTEEGIELCEECGSTLISKWAFEQAGVKDPRRFYTRDVNIKVREKRFEGKGREMEPKELVGRLMLPADVNREHLIKRLEDGWSH